MAQAGIMSFMQPVHAIQALDNADVMPLGIQQIIKLVCAANHQYCPRAFNTRVMMSGDADGGKTAF